MNYLKVPTELCQFALRTRQTTQASAYLAGQLLYSGACRISDNPAQEIASTCGVSVPTVYRSFEWLLSRNWMGTDGKAYFFRRLNRIHCMEGWEFKRAALMKDEDLKHFQSFCVGALAANAIKTGGERARDRKSRRSKPKRAPIPVAYFQEVMGVSRRTAINYLNIAKKDRYVEIYPHFRQVINISPNDVKQLRFSAEESVTVKYFGSPETENVPICKLRTKDRNVFVQSANFFSSHVLLKKRRSR